nr:hypothetical protein [Providencia alcalifaciens]
MGVLRSLLLGVATYFILRILGANLIRVNTLLPNL